MLFFGYLFNDSCDITECCVASVYDVMYLVYFHATIDKIGIMILLGLHWVSSLSPGENPNRLR
jgi:hypothetical protein